MIIYMITLLYLLQFKDILKIIYTNFRDCSSMIISQIEGSILKKNLKTFTYLQFKMALLQLWTIIQWN